MLYLCICVCVFVYVCRSIAASCLGFTLHLHQECVSEQMNTAVNWSSRKTTSSAATHVLIGMTSDIDSLDLMGSWNVASWFTKLLERLVTLKRFVPACWSWREVCGDYTNTKGQLGAKNQDFPAVPFWRCCAARDQGVRCVSDSPTTDSTRWGLWEEEGKHTVINFILVIQPDASQTWHRVYTGSDLVQSDPNM